MDLIVKSLTYYRAGLRIISTETVVPAVGGGDFKEVMRERKPRSIEIDWDAIE